MPWGPAPVTTLIAPEDAGPDDPSIIIFPDPIPAELVAFYAPDTVVHCMLFQQTSSDYVYFAFIDPVVGRSFLAVGGMESVGAVVSEVAKIRIGTIGINTSLSVNDLRITDQAPFFIDQQVAPRAREDRVDSTASTAAIAGETVVLTGNSITWRNGYAYRVKFRGATLSSAANAFIYRIRKTNLAGAILHVTQDLGNAAGVTMYDEMVIVRTAGSNTSGNIVLTLEAGAGTVQMLGATTFVRYMEIWNLGPASADYANAIAF